ncbi:MAG: FAD-dependent oxidoreductase [Dietzia sp.]|uniref:FAD-dependent oxidoreductase n=1 Tax=Dietzia sp. TaxID=1871616 RepID=UPI0027268EEF|nr:FAD-dependent oxidoreductase [Dietzia sp.]MDO8393811.1 FAD-dependent oxidoreductase [Dietzia sp.]
MGTSFWRRTTIDPPVAEFPEGEHVDIVVVGAGFTGLITALIAAARGSSVVVLEAHTVGAGASGSTTAKVSVLQGTRLSTIRSHHGLETARAYAEANQYGLDWWAEFCGSHGVDVQRPRAVTFSRSLKGTSTLRSEKRALDALGLPARWYDRIDVPFPARAAVELPDQMQLDPVEALAALVRATTALGVRIVEHSRVTGLDVRGQDGDAHVEVRSDGGTCSARDVVLATASPALDRGPTAASMEAERSYLCAFEYPGGLPEGMYGSVESPVRSLRTVPVGGREVLLVGGNGHRTGTAAGTDSKIDSLREYAARHFPGAEFTHGWSAQDFHPVTLVPKSGPMPWGKGRVHFAGGYSKWGLTGAPAAAGIMVDRLSGREPRVSFGKPSVTGVLRTAVSLYADLPVQLAATAVQATLRPPRPTLRPIGEATGDDGRTCRVGLLCPHMGAALSWNEAERSWDCPWHGSRFSACGELLEGPATRDLKRYDEA